MPAYNADRFVQRSIDSILAQTWQDLELLVVDDGSSDGTPGILHRVADRRLRILTNEANIGLVASLNRAMRHARGRFIARLDADDIAVPTRIARQVDFLECHPDVVLAGSRWWDLQDGRLRPSTRQFDPDPTVLRWLMHVCNPIASPTMLFRASLVDRLGEYMRPEFFLAEDFDFSHRALRLGSAAVMAERLVLYRRHGESLTGSAGVERLAEPAAAVLRELFGPLLGSLAGEAADLVATHFMGGAPVAGRADLDHLDGILETLFDAYLRLHAPTPAQRARMQAATRSLRRMALHHAIRSGLTLREVFRHPRMPVRDVIAPVLHRVAASAVEALFPESRLLWATRRAIVRPIARDVPPP